MNELEKCKNDIVYFVENYIVDNNGNHIKLYDYQKFYLRYLQNNENKPIAILNSRSIFKNQAIKLMKSYQEFIKNYDK